MARPPAVCVGADIPCPGWLFRWGPVCKFVADGPIVEGSSQLLPVCVLGAVRDLLKKAERGHRRCRVVGVVGRTSYEYALAKVTNTKALIGGMDGDAWGWVHL